MQSSALLHQVFYGSAVLIRLVAKGSLATSGLQNRESTNVEKTRPQALFWEVRHSRLTALLHDWHLVDYSRVYTLNDITVERTWASPSNILYSNHFSIASSWPAFWIMKATMQFIELWLTDLALWDDLFIFPHPPLHHRNRLHPIFSKGRGSRIQIMALWTKYLPLSSIEHQ